MASQFIAQIQMWGCNFAPRDWAFCDGSLLPISTNSALFSLIGDYYGGDARTTVGLPDLKGRAPTHFGHAPGLSIYLIGEMGGFPEVTLTNSTMPTHNHLKFAQQVDATLGEPKDHMLARAGISGGRRGFTPLGIYHASESLGPMNQESAVTYTGGGLPHENRQPLLAVNFCIALQGIYPSRN